MLFVPRRATPEISVDQLDELLRDDAAHVLDVREEWEYVRGHVPGALHVPLHALHAQLDDLPRDRRIAVICQSGNRSLGATDLLLAKGFEGTASVAGGTGAWARSGRAIEQGVPRA